MPARSRSSSPRLTLDVIVDTAATLVAEEGFEALSMRRLAQECGVGVMTLYGYVRTKDDVLEALANRLLSTVELPVDDTLSWQEHVALVFCSVRSVLLTHPELLPIVATQRLDGLAAYRSAESLFRRLEGAGLVGAQVVHAFDALVSFTIGSVQREVALEPANRGRYPTLGALPHNEFPHVIKLAGHLVAADLETSFRVGLDLLIDGITSRTENQARTRKGRTPS